MSEEYVIHGPPLEVPPALCSAGAFLHGRLLENLHKGVLFINEATRQQITYTDFLQYSCRLANSLAKYGITSNQVASVCSENSGEYFIPVLACLYAGVPLAPINPMYTETEFTHSFNLTKPEVIFCSVKNIKKMLNMKKKFPQIKLIIVINSNERIDGAYNLREFLEGWSNPVNIHSYKPVEVDVDNHTAFIMFSSGTTGLPKGVMITHRNVNVKNAIYLTLLTHNPSQYTLGFLPFFHAFGLHNGITAMMYGSTIVVLEKFDFELYLSCVQNYKITKLSGAPPIMQMYAKSPLVDKYDLSHVEQIMVGAGPVAASLEKAVKQRLNVQRVGQGYGLTEATIGLVITPMDVEKPGSCGKLLPSLTAVVKDLETGRNLGPNQDGELCFKGGVIMKGYYNDEAANREAFTQDGYMRTGDIGHYDEEGFFYIVDRLKELIKYKGYQVAPAELEGILLNNPKIKEVGVVGLPDADVGELPLAFVVKQPDAILTEGEVIEYVKKYVSPTKYLRGGVIFIAEIPRNPSGKILRRDLKNMLKSFKSKL